MSSNYYSRPRTINYQRLLIMPHRDSVTYIKQRTCDVSCDKLTWDWWARVPPGADGLLIKKVTKILTTEYEPD